MATPLERIEGKYEILEKMREGGMGAVYRVRHRLLDEVRVIKMMRQHLAQDEVLRSRFLREAKLAIKMQHRNLAQLYDFTMDDEGNAFIVMEFIEGLTLQDLLRSTGAVSPGLALEIAGQTLDVLGYLHRKGVVHRDISPDNLMLTLDDEGAALVKLIDLGIAKVDDPTGGLTATGTFLGKVRYSSPEQLRTQEGLDVDARTDLYSFGIVLYELLTGRYPIPGTTTSALIAGHLLNPPIAFEDSDPDGHIPDDLRALVLAAMAKEPSQRPATAGAMLKALAPVRQRFPFDSREAREVLEAPRRPTRRLAGPRPGSTQDQLDRQFALGATPPPEPTGREPRELPAVEPPAPPARGGRQVKALLLGAQKLVEAHHYDEARLQLATVLDLEPDNRDAAALIKAIEAADQKQRARRNEAAGEVAALIDAGRLAKAKEHLAAARERLGEDDQLAALEERIASAEAEARERHERFERLLEEGGAMVEAGRWAEALDRLSEAQPLEPADDRLRELLARAKDGHGRELEAQRRRQEVDRAAATLAAQLLEGQLDEAARGLALARKVYGNEPAFAPLAARLETARATQRSQRAAALLGEARALAAEQLFAEALEKIEQARSLDPKREEASSVEAEVRSALAAHEEEARRRRELDESLAKIDRLLEASRLAGAGRLLEETRARLGGHPELDERSRRIEGASAELERCREVVKAALDRARRHADQGQLDEAAAAVEEARAGAAEQPELDEAVAETDGLIQQRLEQHRLDLSVTEAATSIAARVAAEELDDAERELGLAERLYGPREAFIALRAELEEHRREQRRRRVEALLAQAFGKRASFSEVIADLEEALAIDPEHEKARRLLAETREAMVRHRREQRAAAWAEVLPRVDDLVADGRLADAVGALDGSLEELGPLAEATAYRTRLKRMLKPRRG